MTIYIFLFMGVCLFLIYIKTLTLKYIHCNTNERSEYIEHINPEDLYVDSADHDYF